MVSRFARIFKRSEPVPSKPESGMQILAQDINAPDTIQSITGAGAGGQATFVIQNTGSKKRKRSLFMTKVRNVFRRKAPGLGISLAKLADGGSSDVAANTDTSEACRIEAPASSKSPNALRSPPKFHGPPPSSSRSSLSSATSVVLPDIPPADLANSSLSPRPCSSRQRLTPIGKPLSKPNDGAEFQLDVKERSRMFNGAPQFSTTREANGAIVPVALYPDDNCSFRPFRGASDILPIPHEAFFGCTNAKPKNLAPSSLGRLFDVWETPSMESYFGVEPGAVSWQYFLECQIMDIWAPDEVEEADGIQDIDALNTANVRSADLSVIIDRLRELSKIYRASASTPPHLGILKGNTPVGLYSQLFTSLLYPPNRIEDHDDPYSLLVQCEELHKTLATKKVWVDFSQPEERIRIGSILWGGDGAEGKSSLLLQILLSCELVLRSDAIWRGTQGPFDQNHIRTSFQQMLSEKVKWDMLVAKRWMENIRIVENPYTPDFTLLTPESHPQEKKHWLGGMLANTVPDEGNDENQDPDLYDALLLPRYQGQQVSGLLYFAQEIGWPDIEMLSGVLAEKLRSPYGFVTPLATPGLSSPAYSPSSFHSPTSQRSSYFGNINPQTFSALIRTLGPGGWLSRMYLTNLVLPGEGISHLLMGALLENDPLALQEIGDSAVFYGGFVRQRLTSGKSSASWWSTAGIVGRCLAGGENVGHTTGWIGNCVGFYEEPVEYPITPPTRNNSTRSYFHSHESTPGVSSSSSRNFTPVPPSKPFRAPQKPAKPAGWIDVLCAVPTSQPKQPILKSSECLGMESNMFGVEYNEGDKLLRTDFIHPELICNPKKVEARVAGLRFWDLDKQQPNTLHEGFEGGHATQAEYRAEVVFTIRDERAHDAPPSTFTNSEMAWTVGVDLTYHVSFITSYPCFPSPSSPSASRAIRVERKSRSTHPLHKSFSYMVVEMHSLISDFKPITLDSEAIDSPIIVFNAFGGKDNVVYARTWCSKLGISAIISTSERTCLSCCIRQAKACGVLGVILGT